MRLDLRKPKEDSRKKDLEADAVFTALRNAAPADIDGWIDANVNNLPQARQVLKALLKLAVLQLKGTL